ncbi:MULTISPECIES: hypothetical protein [unclassified Methylobacterium]|uniref:hypothetical protein n=1 Tax=unclassified Methylobacterium TaxID=2615210 RepID=UPI0006FEC2ED|nr:MULTISPECIES: hypothetical protein [unclassified Methylobacterium]KQO49359.1 hypothetical protein ASF24_09430 [Methylobacterium sp. Leaf86]KQP00414.1 hypothetical protein ASF32_00530 [Methylobacterium sp. Leaf91]MBO1022396.1 hypothetical protein [Methylobacterium sp. SD274]
MNESPDPSANATDPIGRLSEVSRLASLLADRVLSAQIASQPIPKAHIHALLDAAIILEKYERDLPPLLEQMIGKLEDEDSAKPVADREDEEAVPEPAEGEEADAKRLAWLFRPFKGTKG